MSVLHFHGHATFSVITEDGTRLVIDPFFDDNPQSDTKTADMDGVDYILCTHGHTDHFADAIPLAQRTGATLISTYEIVSYVQSKGIENAHPMHIGGGFDFPFGRVKMTAALHGGMVHGDDAGAFTTVPGGFLIDVDSTRLYFAGDTALLTDMQLLRDKVDIAMLPIGDNFTMGPEDAATAVEFIRPKTVIPFHYDTWDVIAQDPAGFARRVGDTAEVVVLTSGDDYEF